MTGPRRRRPTDADRLASLTEKQSLVFAAILSHTAEAGYPPTLTWIAERLGITAPTVFHHVKILAVKGYIERDPNLARGIRITDLGQVNAPKDAA